MANYERRDEQYQSRGTERIERRDQVQKPEHGFYERACARLRKALGELPTREMLERMRRDAEAVWGGPADYGPREPRRRDPWYDEVETRFRESLGEWPDRETLARWREDAEAAWAGGERDERWGERSRRRPLGREHSELEGERYRGGERMFAERSGPDRGAYGPGEGMRRGGGYGGGGPTGYGGFGRRFGEYDERYEPGRRRR